MITRTEKTGEMSLRTENACPRKAQAQTAAAVLWAVMGFIIAEMKIGGAASPFGASLAAAGSPLSAWTAVFGMFCAWAAAGSLWKHISELSAAAFTAAFLWIFRKKCTPKMRSLAAGGAYFISSAAVSAANGGDWVMFIAVFFRAVMCSGAAYCLCETVRAVKTGF